MSRKHSKNIFAKQSSHPPCTMCILCRVFYTFLILYQKRKFYRNLVKRKISSLLFIFCAFEQFTAYRHLELKNFLTLYFAVCSFFAARWVKNREKCRQKLFYCFRVLYKNYILKWDCTEIALLCVMNM